MSSGFLLFLSPLEERGSSEGKSNIAGLAAPAVPVVPVLPPCFLPKRVRFGISTSRLGVFLLNGTKRYAFRKRLGNFVGFWKMKIPKR